MVFVECILDKMSGVGEESLKYSCESREKVNMVISDREKWPEVSIILVNWNQEEDTCECLESLRRVNFNNYEIIVVDNGSVDGSPDRIQKKFPEVVLIRNKENLGFAEGNNIGIRYALRKGADYVFLLNSDTIADQDVLSELIKVAEASEDIGIVGARTYYYDDPQRIWASGRIFNRWKGSHFDIASGRIDEGQFENSREVDDIPGSSFFIKSEVIREIGLLEPLYFLFFEETDWCACAQKAGYKILTAPKAKIWHKVSATTTPFMMYFLTRNRPLFMLRNSKARYLLPFFIYYFFQIVLRGILRFIYRGDKRTAILIYKGFVDFLRWNYGKGRLEEFR